jgi:hypothetical protein
MLELDRINNLSDVPDILFGVKVVLNLLCNRFEPSLFYSLSLFKFNEARNCTLLISHLFSDELNRDVELDRNFRVAPVQCLDGVQYSFNCVRVELMHLPRLPQCRDGVICVHDIALPLLLLVPLRNILPLKRFRHLFDYQIISFSIF